MSVIGPCGLQGSAASAVVAAKIAVSKTVGTVAGACATTQSIQVAQNTPVYYCVTVKNVGGVPLTYHVVSDPVLGVNTSVNYLLGVGAEMTVTNLQDSKLGPDPRRCAHRKHGGRHVVRLAAGAQRLG